MMKTLIKTVKKSTSNEYPVIFCAIVTYVNMQKWHLQTELFLHVSELSSCPLVQSTWPSHRHDHGMHGCADPQLKWSALHSTLPINTSDNWWYETLHTVLSTRSCTTGKDSNKNQARSQQKCQLVNISTSGGTNFTCQRLRKFWQVFKNGTATVVITTYSNMTTLKHSPHNLML